jgi:hypothetical protein
LGDSFCRIYQFPEPQSLGQTVDSKQSRQRYGKRLLPGSAGLLSHLALALKTPVACMISDGGAATDVRKRLGVYAEIMEGKQVVIWEFVERDIRCGTEGWQVVPLPPEVAEPTRPGTEGGGPHVQTSD